jgi:hypothetical protein
MGQKSWSIWQSGIAHLVKQSTHDPKLAGLNPALLAKGECNEKHGCLK